ncbi:MAG: sulfotransferase [Desulfobacterium sp.]|nr:sulfotransferase [Desulfobacterium sp.]MBU4009521.1 sulfotransferase [Pseudomonadota bacterium]MBU4037390.1 sulfotransferase [Pseudomonadota bacterium]
MKKIAYITSSSFSGSTLLSFLMNMHPNIFTIGEMDGWNYGPNESFLCSCGETLESCPFFTSVNEHFLSNNIKFDFRNFNTSFSLSNNAFIARLLGKEMPFWINSSLLEKTRDKIVNLIPYYNKAIKSKLSANDVFIKAAFEYSGCDVFVDACKDPFRLRYLKNVPMLDLEVIYLVRDFRGFILSCKKNKGWNWRTSLNIWIRQQKTILRILDESLPYIKIHYEDIINSTDETLASIYSFIGVQDNGFTGDFRSVEHHVLGNDMRLKQSGQIQKNERWKKELPINELQEANNYAERFIKKNPMHPLSSIMSRYINEK